MKTGKELRELCIWSKDHMKTKGYAKELADQLEKAEAILSKVEKLNRWSANGVVAGTVPGDENDFNWIYAPQLESTLKGE